MAPRHTTANPPPAALPAMGNAMSSSGSASASSSSHAGDQTASWPPPLALAAPTAAGRGQAGRASGGAVQEVGQGFRPAAVQEVGGLLLLDTAGPATDQGVPPAQLGAGQAGQQQQEAATQQRKGHSGPAGTSCAVSGPPLQGGGVARAGQGGCGCAGAGCARRGRGALVQGGRCTHAGAPRPLPRPLLPRPLRQQPAVAHGLCAAAAAPPRPNAATAGDEHAAVQETGSVRLAQPGACGVGCGGALAHQLSPLGALPRAPRGKRGARRRQATVSCALLKAACVLLRAGPGQKGVQIIWEVDMSASAFNSDASRCVCAHACARACHACVRACACASHSTLSTHAQP